MTELYLHVLVFDLLTSRDAVGDVEVDELWRQVHSCGQPEGVGGTESSVILKTNGLLKWRTCPFRG